MLVQSVAILCVLGIGVGQILFKMGAMSLSRGGSLFEFRTVATLGAALLLYAITTVAWIWVLQREALGRVYPWTALAFVLVPVGSHFVFGERFPAQYFLGVALISAGIVVALKS